MLYYIGQALGIFATIADIVTFQLKSKKQMLFLNLLTNLAVAFNIFFINKEISSGGIICLIAIVQLIVSFYHDEKGKDVSLIIKIIFLVVYIAGGIIGFTKPIDILSIVAAILYMVAMFQKDPQKIRIILLGNMFSWVVYFLFPFSTSIFAQFAGIISSLIGIYRYRKDKKTVA